MNEHKTKYFKKVFDENADDVLNLNDQKEHVMTKTTFVVLAGQVYDRAKERYKKRYQKKALEFAEWLQKNYHPALNGWTHRDPIIIASIEKMIYTTEELYEIWKNEIK